MVFYEGVDDVRCLLPPERIADVDRVVRIPVGDIAVISRTQLRLGMFLDDAAVVIAIIQVVIGIRLGRLDFKNRPFRLSAIVSATRFVFPVAEK